MNKIRPIRDFTIGKHKREEPPVLDGSVQGHIEGLLAEEILEGEDISFIFDGTTAQLSAESHMLISGKATHLLREAHQKNPAIPDLSLEVSVKNMLINNALEIVSNHEKANCSSAQAEANRNNVLTEPETL